MGSIVVADASPLISLDRIGRLDLIASVFPEVYAPPVVATEVGLDLLRRNSWLVVRNRQKPTPPWAEQKARDPGEFDALLLAIELVADVVLIDDLDGRRWASQHGLFITGTLGIILTAKEAGVIPAIRPIVDLLISSGFRSSAVVREHVLRTAGEN